MIFEKHSNLSGQHAFLSASGYHWLFYDDEKLLDVYEKHLAKEKGTKLHALAAELIDMGIKLPDSPQTLNRYVNDAIGFKMTTEQVLFYSIDCFGTADAICFRNNVLRIHDLKTGSAPTSMNQLLVYAALFCLEYKYKPSELDDIILRIYQNDEIQEMHATAADIVPVMDKIVTFSKKLHRYRREVMGI